MQHAEWQERSDGGLLELLLRAYCYDFEPSCINNILSGFFFRKCSKNLIINETNQISNVAK